MIRKKIPLRLLLLGAALFLLYNSCRKESGLGRGFIDDENLLNVQSDSFRLNVLNKPVDSILTSGAGRSLVGYLNSPVTGLAFAGVAANFSDVDNITSIDLSSTQVDSAVLSIRHNAQFGPGTPVVFQAHVLQDPILDDEDYYSNENPPVGSLLGQSTFTVPNLDSITVFDDREPSQIRIPLKPILASEMLTQVVNDPNGFQNQYPGIYLTADTTPGSSLTDGLIAQVDIDNSYSTLRFYLSDVNTGAKNVLSLELNGLNRYNVFHHSYGFSELSANLNQTNPQLQVIQSVGGNRVLLFSEEFNEFLLNNTNITIQKAELRFNPTLDQDPRYFAHPQLILRTRVDTGWINILDILESSDHYGGALDNNEYLFHVTRYVQDLSYSVSNGLNDTFALDVIPNEFGVRDGYRTFLDGNVQLRLFYVKN